MPTFIQLKTRTAREIGAINVTDDATALGEWANDAVRDVLLRTGVKVTTDTLALTAGTNDYTLDSDVMAIKAAYIDGARPLEQVSPDEIDHYRAAGSLSSSVLRYALEGTDLFMVYPTPSASATLNLRVLKRPTEMTSDAHDPSDATYGGVPIEFHPVLVEYMCWRAASFDDDQSSGQGVRYRDEYEAGLKRVRRYVNGKGGVRLPRARVGRPRRVPSDPSADWRG